jgi:hypothetical protein
MPRELLFAKNNVAGNLAEPLGLTDLTATLAAGQGALFPTTADCPYHVTVSLSGNSAIHEILHVIERDGDTLIFTRGAEGTFSRSFAAESPVELRQTAQQFNDLNELVKSLEWFVSVAWGGGNGVIRYGAAPDDGLKVVPGGGIRVQVQPGAAFLSNLLFRLSAAFMTPNFIMPAQYARIDLVQANAATGLITVKQGADAQAPVAPVADTDCLALARVYCRAGMTSIDVTDIGTNGYIIDQRSFV